MPPGFKAREVLFTEPSPLSPPRPHATIFYHYFHPDDVVSARHFTDLAEGLAARGWSVTAVPCVRGCREESAIFPMSSEHNGVAIRRVWRPNWRQASGKGRVLNASWMLGAWGARGMFGRRHQREVMIVGTDPILGVLSAIPWGMFRRKCGIAHWCFDLYPEAPIAEGMINGNSRPVRLLKRLLAVAYRRCDLIADLGSCMADLLKPYGSPARAVTLPPWALDEPATPTEPDPAARRELFGDAKLGLLYSGSFGRAHEYRDFLQLARLLRGSPIQLCFAGRGNRMDELKAAVGQDDRNISFAGFAPESELAKRLGACDLHLVSLREAWTGTVVPSKFFGALAAGRGVVFAGSPHSAIARWIEEHRVGWVLRPESLAKSAGELRQLAEAPGPLVAMRSHCHEVYAKHFSRERIIDRWDAELRKLLPQARE